MTARPSHAVWQGKVYTKEQCVSICEFGAQGGLLGVNCRHYYDPFIDGSSKRRYTDEQLAKWMKKANETHTFNGRRYTLYEATQRKRALERQIRIQDEKIRLL